MDVKNVHGSIFKKLREEREYTLKDVAGGVISTRTLIRCQLFRLFNLLLRSYRH